MHTYITKEGKEVPSVTTILKILGAEEIIRWANYLGYKHISYESEMERTSTKGTIIHQLARNVVDPKSAVPIQLGSEADFMFYSAIQNRFQSFISQFTYETFFTETGFVSSKLGYGGTVDWYCKIADIPILVDFKSSKQVRLKHLLQLGGYYNLMRDGNYTIHGGAIITVNERGCTIYPIKEDTLIELGANFNKLADVYFTLNGGKYMPEKSDELMKLLKRKT